MSNKNQDQNIKENNLLLQIDGSKNVSFDALNDEYTEATNKIFNEIKYEIKNYDEIQKNNRIVYDLRKNEFKNFVSALRELGIKLPNDVNEQYFQGNDCEKVMEQIDKINAFKEPKELLKERCCYYHDLKNAPKENKIEANDLNSLRKYVDCEEFFTQRLKCLILICKDQMYISIHGDAKKLLEQIASDLKNNGLMFNEGIKNEINKDIIQKYNSVVSKFYEGNKSKINKIFFKAAQIKNEYEVKIILEQLEEQDRIQKQKEEEERKKQEELKEKNNKDESKTEKNGDNKEKNNNEKANNGDNQTNIDKKNKTDDNEKNNEKYESDKETSSMQKKINNKSENINPKIDLERKKNVEEQERQKKQRIIDVAESSYFQSMLYTDLMSYKTKTKENTLVTADTYTAFRNLSLNFASQIRNNYLGNDGLSFPEYQQNQEVDEFLIQYLRDDKFKEFKFQNKPIRFENYGRSISYSYYDEISAKAATDSDSIAKKQMSNNFIFKSQEFGQTIGTSGCDSTNNDCFIWALLSHISLEELKDIKKFVNKNRKCSLPVWSNNLELSKDNSGKVVRKTRDLFSWAGGTNLSIDDQAKTVAYVRAALAIKIAQNQASKLETQENWEEFLTLLGCGPKKDEKKITGWDKRDVNGNANMVAQAVVDLTQRPFLLIYSGIENGYLLKTKTHIADGDNTKTEFGLQLGVFSFNNVYDKYNDNSNLPSESFRKAKKELLRINQRLLCLINDENVISIKLGANGNVWTTKTSGHFYAIGRNYTGETLTRQKNNAVFDKFDGERNLKTNSELRKNLNQLGLTEKNKNMPSCYFLANVNNCTVLQDIIVFLQKLDSKNAKANDSKNIKADFDKWFKDFLCNADGKIDEKSFANRVIKLFHSENEKKELFKDDNKVDCLRKAINMFLSYVPSHFHSKWFQTINTIFTPSASFFKDTVIGNLEKIKLENGSGIKYFGYLIGKFVKFLEEEAITQEKYNKWKKEFIDSDYLETILTRKNDIENNFLSEVKENKFAGYNNQNIVNDLFKFISLFDPSDLYVLIGVVEKKENCDVLRPLYNLSPKTVSQLINLFRKFAFEKEENQNEIKKAEEKKENQNGIEKEEKKKKNEKDTTSKKQDDIRNEYINLIELLGKINSKNPNGILDKIISDSENFEELKDYLKTIKSIIGYGDDAKNFLFNLDFESFKKVLDYFKQEKNQNEIKKGDGKKEDENDDITHTNLIKLLVEINSKNPSSLLAKIISDSENFEELKDYLKTIKSIIDHGNDAKTFLFNLDFESFKKVLGYFKQEKEKEKKENEKKGDKQEYLWDFIKNKKYDRDDIQKIVSVSDSLDEIKNNFKSLDDTVKIDQCKICQQENKTDFWNLFTGIKNSISKIFSLFQKNDNKNINVEKNIDETSLESIAEALDKDDDEGENARIMFYTMSKHMGSEEMEQLWKKIDEYMGKKKGNNEKPKEEEEINTNSK